MIKKVLKYFQNLKIENVWYFLGTSFVIRLFLANFGTLQLDHGTFIAWGNQLAENGFKDFYSGWSDYLPGYLYILWFLGKLNIIFPELQTIIFKLPAIVADVITGFLIYKNVKKNKNEKWGMGTSFLYLFNPAIIANSTLWGQVDSLTALFSLLSVYVFPVSIFYSSLSLAVATVIKPQAAFILPAIIYLFIINKKKISDFFIYCLTGLSAFVFFFIPFNNNGGLFDFILKRLNLSAVQYPYGSVNAFSFWGFFGFWKDDSIIFWIGFIITLIFIGDFIFYLTVKNKKDKEYVISCVSLLIIFLCLTRMHERHLLPALPFILISSSQVKILMPVYLILSTTYVANLAYSYYWITDNFKEIFNSFMCRFFIFLNLLSFLYTYIISLNKRIETKLSKSKLLNLRIKMNRGNKKEYFNGKDVSTNTSKKILILILFFSLVTRFWGLGYPKEEYFDEVYHAFTARLMLHEDPKAWEWWNPHPEGFAYEWTHPPLAKLGMVLGMKIFGENSFGFRSVQAILGVGIVFLVYLLTFEIFNDRKTSLLASFLISLDGLVLVMNRIGMNDTYLVFFILLSLVLFIKNRFFMSSLSFGLAISSKWSAIYFLPILAVSHIVFKKKIKIDYFAELFDMLKVYLISKHLTHYFEQKLVNQNLLFQ